MESIEVLLVVFYFIFGTIIGSFLNVVSLRYNTGVLLLGRSRCFSCNRGLKWFELIPVLSFIFQFGKCSKCKSKISLQYPFIEILTGSIFLGIFIKFSDLLFVSPTHFLLLSFYFMILFSILIVILIYDLKHKIIPDDLVYTFATLSLLGMFFDFGALELSIPTLLPFSSGPLLFLPFFLLWSLSKGKWIGLGDGKLVLGIGWLLGWSLAGSAILLSFWIGAVVSVVLMLFFALNLRNKRITMKSEIPFGPFLILGLFIVFFFNINVFDFII